MTTTRRPVLVVEDDPFLRILQVVLDPDTTAERFAAFADFFSHDLPDFQGWCDGLRQQVDGLYPAEVRLMRDEAELQANLGDAAGIVTESLQVGPDELAKAPGLQVVQKYGVNLRNIDTAACEARGIPVLTVRRRANVACAEATLAFMLTFAKKLHEIEGLISFEQLREAGYDPHTFDRRHTANSGWARVAGLQMLYESTLGIIGLGEIGQELAVRAVPFGMRVLYHQRTKLDAATEQRLGVEYAALDQLLGESDWVSLQLPRGVRDFLGAKELAMMKPGAFLINTAQAVHVNRPALIEALKAGRLGGFALDPLYEEPSRPDDELLQFDNVLLTPHTAAQPRFNALRDQQDMILGMALAFRAPAG